jgi:hypothetical protein
MIYLYHSSQGMVFEIFDEWASAQAGPLHGPLLANDLMQILEVIRKPERSSSFGTSFLRYALDHASATDFE